MQTMCSTNKLLTFPRFHFLRMECPAKSMDTIKYVIKNPFNIPIIQVKGKISRVNDSSDFLELDVIDVQTSTKNGPPNILFRITATSYPQQFSDTVYKSCTLISTSEETLGRVVDVKDVGLSTCTYSITDGDNQLALQVYTKHVSDEHRELHIQLPFNEEILGRLSVYDNSISISMAPEADSITKMRLLTLMIFTEIRRKCRESSNAKNEQQHTFGME